jgi:hypothetical protein
MLFRSSPFMPYTLEMNLSGSNIAENIVSVLTVSWYDSTSSISWLMSSYTIFKYLMSCLSSWTWVRKLMTFGCARNASAIL